MAIMIISSKGLPFIHDYINAINTTLNTIHPGKRLTRLQCVWLQFVLMGLLITNSLCWEKFKRYSLGRYGASASCWMFRHAQICWELLLSASVSYLLGKYKVKSGHLILDDTANQRSKNTTEIAYLHKIKDKKTGGFFDGQEIIFLLLVVEGGITLPVGFKFYQPDPAQKAWRKEDERLRKKGVAKEHRPAKPADDPQYPLKIDLALELIESFQNTHTGVCVKSIMADCAYGSKKFMQEARALFPTAQIISQLSQNQLIMVNGVYTPLKKFFSSYQGSAQEITLRYQKKTIRSRSGKFKVKAYGKKCFIIALKYEGEEEYRYLVADDLSWREQDVIQAYGLRWLVEVFIEDWKNHEGWCQLAKQQGSEGADRGLLLSLLCDHALHLHPEQINSFEHKELASTVGSLREKVMMESLISFIEDIIEAEHPQEALQALSEKIIEHFQLKPSLKHMRPVQVQENQALQGDHTTEELHDETQR